MRKALSVLAIILVASLSGCSSSGGAQPGSTSRTDPPITLAEIDAAGGGNAYDLVQSRRPNWLRTRGTQSFNEAARGVGGGTGSGAGVSAQPGQTPILVYLGSARLGGTEALRQIDLRTIGSIEYLQRSAADYRFGPGHLHGAIVLSPRQ